ncbi:hypothetical protein BJ508DRAFT_327926 [Ascobolus immersus RN42]|uniref:Uncharacterized protein n=1 Tax=Ascobolus immersus RN42 TaxID=1160509 RepID=A0A3N4IDS7_ASCIM|nr:hypothetical protein BJ508DRAFT_327926 [Ascobolus immersus RN42]
MDMTMMLKRGTRPETFSTLPIRNFSREPLVPNFAHTQHPHDFGMHRYSLFVFAFFNLLPYVAPTPGNPFFDLLGKKEELMAVDPDQPTPKLATPEALRVLQFCHTWADFVETHLNNLNDSSFYTYFGNLRSDWRKDIYAEAMRPIIPPQCDYRINTEANKQTIKRLLQIVPSNPALEWCDRYAGAVRGKADPLPTVSSTDFKELGKLLANFVMECVNLEDNPSGSSLQYVPRLDSFPDLEPTFGSAVTNLAQNSKVRVVDRKKRDINYVLFVSQEHQKVVEVDKDGHVKVPIWPVAHYSWDRKPVGDAAVVGMKSKFLVDRDISTTITFHTIGAVEKFPIDIWIPFSIAYLAFAFPYMMKAVCMGRPDEEPQMGRLRVTLAMLWLFPCESMIITFMCFNAGLKVLTRYKLRHFLIAGLIFQLYGVFTVFYSVKAYAVNKSARWKHLDWKRKEPEQPVPLRTTRRPRSFDSGRSTTAPSYSTQDPNKVDVEIGEVDLETKQYAARDKWVRDATFLVFMLAVIGVYLILAAANLQRTPK